MLSLALTSGIAAAGITYDESLDGDLSSDPNAPTALAFELGANTVSGTVTLSNQPTGDRDYITFEVGAGQRLSALFLRAYAPDDLGFAAFNAGATSFIPDGSTDANFLSGILPGASQVGTDLMPAFVSDAVTTNSLANPWLDAGVYSFVIQQTSPAMQAYTLEFVITPAPATGSLLCLGALGLARRRR
ncbi:MAG: hypothetical protein RIB60_00490 [Phycisphaerales bacterium]